MERSTTSTKAPGCHWCFNTVWEVTLINQGNSPCLAFGFYQSMREAMVVPLPRLIHIDLRLVVSPTTFARSSTI
jgi:hypothetical protein